MMYDASGRPAPPVRSDGTGVGVYARNVGIGRIESINTGHAAKMSRALVGRHGGGISAEIGGHPKADREKLVVGAEREFGAKDIVAPVIVSNKRLAAFGHPAHGPLKQARRPYDDRVLRKERALQAEAATDIVNNDAKPFQRFAEYIPRPRTVAWNALIARQGERS